MIFINKIDEFLDDMANNYPEVPLNYPTGLKEAIIGSTDNISLGTVLLLDRNKCLDILSKTMTYEEAIEYYDYNLEGSYIEGGPIYCTLIDGIFN